MKLTADGTNVGKRLLCVVFAFILLDECDQSVDGIHPLALFKEPEKYVSLKVALADIIEEVEQTKEVTVNEQTFKVRIQS